MNLTSRTYAQWYCLLAGVALVVKGSAGLLVGHTDFDLPGGGWHEVFHVASGACLLAVSRARRPAYAGAIVFGAVYAVLAVAGFAAMDNALGVFPVDTRVDVTHLVYSALGLAAVVFGPDRVLARSRSAALGRASRGS